MAKHSQGLFKKRNKKDAADKLASLATGAVPSPEQVPEASIDETSAAQPEMSGIDIVVADNQLEAPLGDGQDRAQAFVDQQTAAIFFEQYAKEEYPKPSVTADICVFRRREGKLQLLLIKRAGHPFMGCWALPGGFSEPGETVDECALRELAEETGVEGANLHLEQMGFYSDPKRDPRGWVMSEAYVCVTAEDTPVSPGDDAREARWFNIDVADSFGVITLELVPEGGAASEEDILLCAFTAKSQPVSGRRRADLMSHDGFPFDHAQIVADAYLVVSDVGLGLR